MAKVLIELDINDEHLQLFKDTVQSIPAVIAHLYAVNQLPVYRNRIARWADYYLGYTPIGSTPLFPVGEVLRGARMVNVVERPADA